MNVTNPTLETMLETEEYISSEEYLQRRERGEINSADVRYAPCSPDGKQIGGFYVKLAQPRYKVLVQPVQETYAYAY